MSVGQFCGSSWPPLVNERSLPSMTRGTGPVIAASQASFDGLSLDGHQLEDVSDEVPVTCVGDRDAVDVAWEHAYKQVDWIMRRARERSVGARVQTANTAAAWSDS